MDIKYLKKLANQGRIHILNQVYNAQSGHIGGAFSAMDILVYLFFERMNYSKDNWDKPDRDRFILSKGHGSASLYSILALKGLIDEEELATFRKIDSRLQGHPSHKSLPYVEQSTGSLGQGLSFANGVALGLKLDKIDSHVYCLIGDGEINEGQIWEALMTSNRYSLDNLTVILDYNHLQIDGFIEDIKNPMPTRDRFESFGFNVIEIDGHDFDDIKKGFDCCNDSIKPNFIIAHTVKGKGVSFMENDVGWHGSPPDKEQYEKAMKELKID